MVTIIVSIVSIHLEQKIESHKNVFKNSGYCHVKMFEEFNKIPNYNQVKKFMKILFVIHAHAEPCVTGKYVIDILVYSFLFIGKYFSAKNILEKIQVLLFNFNLKQKPKSQIDFITSQILFCLKYIVNR